VSKAWTSAGLLRSMSNCVNAPLPQPMSSQRAPFGTSIQSMKRAPTSTLQRPIISS